MCVIITIPGLFIWTMCGEIQERPASKRAAPFCNTLYREDADEPFVGALHLIHYPGAARKIVESESIQQGHDRTCCSSEPSVNQAQQQDLCTKEESNEKKTKKPNTQKHSQTDSPTAADVNTSGSCINLSILACLSTVSVLADSIKKLAVRKCRMSRRSLGFAQLRLN